MQGKTNCIFHHLVIIFNILCIYFQFFGHTYTYPPKIIIVMPSINPSISSIFTHLLQKLFIIKLRQAYCNLTIHMDMY